jgi:chaperonin GroEL
MPVGKVVVIGSEAREEMLKGVNTLANAVKATLGPRGRHVAIERDYGPPLITKDGVTVARYIHLNNRIENMGAQLVKSVASSANSLAGDGTTTATVLAQAIYAEGQAKISEGYNPVLVKRGIDFAVGHLLSRLKGLSASVANEAAMRSVAMISANNDEELGGMIAEAIATVGENGVVSVEEATGSITTVYYTEGLKLDRGLLSEHFINNPGKLTGDFEDCYVIPFNGKLNSIMEALELFQEISQSGKPFLLIVKDIDPEALAQIVHNKVQGSINGAVIKSPGFGDARRAILEDVATITGGKMFSDDDGIGLKGVKLSQLGVAKKVSVGINKTMILEGRASQADVEAKIEEIQNQLSEGDLHEYQRAVLENKLSRLTGVAAVFKVGGASESEMRERKDRVEDAINAVRSALLEGVVPGGGSSLIHALPVLDEVDTSELMEEEVVGVEIVKTAILAPFKQILVNSGVLDDSQHDEYIQKILDADEPSGFDALKLEFVENMLDRGIMDPTKVVRSALEHAASASGTLLTTEVSIYVEERETSD